METGTSTGKSFFQKPEGVTGMLILGGIACVVLYFWSKIVPFLIKMTQDTLHLVVLAGVLFAIVYAIMDPNIRTGLWYLFKTVSRMFTGFVINIDPIAILKTYIADLKVKREEASQKIDEVSGAAEKIKAQITDNLAQATQSKQRYEQGKAQGMDEEALAKYSIRFGGLNEMNAKLKPMYEQFVSVQAFLEKMYKSSGYLIEQMETNVELKEIEYTSIRAANKAMKSVLSMFKGDPDKKAMFDMALENMADDMAMKVGEMKRAMNMSTEYLNSVDIDQGVATNKGLEAMKSFDPSQYTLLTVKDVNTKKNVAPQITASGKSSGISF